MDSEIQHEIDALKKKCESKGEDISDIQKGLYTLIEAQKNTTRNVDNLAADVKELLKNSLNFELLEKEIAQLDKKVNELMESKNWGFKLIVGAVLTGIIGFLINFKIHFN